MKIKLLTVGKIRTGYLQQAQEDYARRIKRYAEIALVEVKDAPQNSLRNTELVKRAEAGEIRKRITTGEFVVAMDSRGKQFSSVEFADFFRRKTLHGKSRFCFVIGGPLGLEDDFITQANSVLSLSKMTLPHELAKVFLMEQIYRSMSIIHGEKYHK